MRIIALRDPSGNTEGGIARNSLERATMYIGIL
jgi:hypothetical protein